MLWDRFTQSNYNSVILARSGAGKSYLAKLEALRSLYRGIDVLVVDPENEYQRLAELVGGTHVRLGAQGVRINPFDLGTELDAYTRRALFIHTLVAVLLNKTTDAATRAALDRGIVAAYKARGISSDTRTHARPTPTLADLAGELEKDGDEFLGGSARAARPLRHRLAPRTLRRSDHRWSRSPSRGLLASRSTR